MTLARLARLPEALQTGWRGIDAFGTVFEVNRAELIGRPDHGPVRVTGRFNPSTGHAVEGTRDLNRHYVVRRPLTMTGNQVDRNRVFTGDLGELTERGFLSWSAYDCNGCPYCPGIAVSFGDMLDHLEDVWVRTKIGS